MDNVSLHRHVLNRFERRRAARFAQTPRRSPSSASRDDPFRSPQVRRLLQGSLKPPTWDRTLEFPGMK
jgi:hypothetical protein